MNPKKATTNCSGDLPGDGAQDILDQYIMELAEQLSEGSGAIGAGKAYMKAASPTIRYRTVDRAKFAIAAVKAGKKPGDPDLQAELDKRMRQTPQMNPLITPDSYGVLAAVSALVQNDPDLSARVKRFYRAMVDNWVKSKLKG